MWRECNGTESPDRGLSPTPDTSQSARRPRTDISPPRYRQVLALAAMERAGNFAAFLGRDFDEALTYAALRKAESLGLPVGSSEWLEDMARQTGQKLLPAKRGPKAKANSGRTHLSP